MNDIVMIGIFLVLIRGPVRPRVAVQRGARMTLELVAGLVALAIGIYLLYTLLRAERF